MEQIPCRGKLAYLLVTKKNADIPEREKNITPSVAFPTID